MSFTEIISAVANLLTALSVTAHFFHSLWKWRTSVSVQVPCMEQGREGIQRTVVEERGSGLHEEE